MSTKAKIPATDEAWDSGQLGRDEAHVKRLEENIEAKIDKSLGLQLISIRLQKSLIDDLKMIATLHGIGYQPLMRQALKRFADCEKKQILRERASEMEAKSREAKAAETPAAKKRKVA